MDKMIADLNELVGFNSVCKKTLTVNIHLAKFTMQYAKALDICGNYGFKTANKKNDSLCRSWYRK